MMDWYGFFAKYENEFGASRETSKRYDDVILYRKPSKIMSRRTCNAIIRAHRGKPVMPMLLDANLARLRRRSGTWVRIDLRNFNKVSANDNGGP